MGAYYALDCRGTLLDRFQDTRCTDHGRVEQVLLDVCDVEVEGRSSVNHGFEWRVGLDRFVEGAVFSNVFDESKVKLVFRKVRVCFLDLPRLFLRTDSCYNRMAVRVLAPECYVWYGDLAHPCCNRISRTCAAIKPLPPVPSIISRFIVTRGADVEG